MPYIGNQPSESFTSFATQEFSTSATTSYTLDHAVTNENEIALFINNVRQQPGSGKAYTATGTALTLSAATASTDTMYCVFLGRALQTVTPATNSITAAMVGNDLVSGKDALTAIPATTDELLISDAGTLKRIDSQFFQNTPAFEAKGSAEQTGVSDNTWTKANFDTEIFDTDGCYDTSNYRFTPDVAGKYHVYAMMGMYGATSDQLQIPNLSIYKNGSNYKYLVNNFNNSYPHNEAGMYLSTVVEMNGSSDYVEVYGRGNVLSGNVTFEPQNTIGLFGAYKIVGA